MVQVSRKLAIVWNLIPWIHIHCFHFNIYEGGALSTQLKMLKDRMDTSSNVTNIILETALVFIE